MYVGDFFLKGLELGAQVGAVTPGLRLGCRPRALFLACELAVETLLLRPHLVDFDAEGNEVGP